MVKLYVSTFDENGVAKYAIYDERNNSHKNRIIVCSVSAGGVV